MQAQPPELSLIKELLTAAQDARRPTSYARRLDRFVATSTIQRQILANYERDLRSLNPQSWALLKAAALKRLMRNERRGWEPLFGILNEAKAFAYLTALGCSDIQMIPPTYDSKAPDLKAELNGSLVLCEVKTIHMTDDALMIHATEPTFQPRPCLSEEFLRGKLTRTLRAAKTQLDAFPSSTARKIIYVVLTPGESSDEYAAGHSHQLSVFLKGLPLAGVEVEIFQFTPTS